MIKFKSFLILSLAIILIAVSVQVQAEIPQVINYQGLLKDDAGEPVSNGLYLIRFRFYTASGVILWDSEYQSIQVTNGVFTYLMGENVTIPTTVFTNHNYILLGLQVGEDPEISPLTKISSVGYAFKALNSDSAEIAENAKMLNNNPPSYYIDWNNQTNIPAGFADGVDDVGNGGEGDITGVEAGNGLAGGGSAGHVVLSLAPEGITSDNIMSNAITYSKLGPDAVTTDKILNYTLTDIDISSRADIEPGKIRGIAVNLEDDQTITAVKTFNNLLIIPTVRRLAVPSSAFDTVISTDPYIRGTGSLINGNIDDIQQYQAPVCLPDGATVIQVKATFYDVDAAGYGYITLMKQNMTNIGDGQMATVGTSGTPGFTTIVDDSITMESINNNGNNYYLIAELQATGNRNNVKLYGVEIVYSISKPLP